MVTYVLTILIAIVVLYRFEKSSIPIQPLVQLLALAVIGRWLFMTIPNVQPTTAILMLTALLVSLNGAAILALFVPILSGLLLGIGPFVLYQFLGWLLVALLVSLFRSLLLKSPVLFLVLGFLSGFLYGWTTNVAFIEVIGADFLKLLLLSFPFDFVHGISNVVFLLLIRPLFERIFLRQLG
ncbi:hypothetical protein PTI97_08120 [Exiguobacterium marinum]|uniref:Energy-coupling factor transport system substrate-specific component n=1 Tax=Exiguobacterium marinum TaxID=273528 RepID=A0ABY7WV86_9BACL|nr:hypothetical protein [Exiguobacterium marinum]WDH74799.1 hypothetical protein PTI97_08120 [Exiguobacterium marinum]